MPSVSHAVHYSRSLENGVVECNNGAREYEDRIIEFCSQELYFDLGLVFALLSV